MVTLTEERALFIHYNMWTRVTNYIKEKRHNNLTFMKIRALRDMYEVDKIITNEEFTVVYVYRECALCALNEYNCRACNIKFGFTDKNNGCLDGRYDLLCDFINIGDYDNASKVARDIANLYYVGMLKIKGEYK